VRREINRLSHTVIEEISKDLSKMWRILHPNREIENVRLYVPEDKNKAVDIGLSFHGIDQDSPRLTLSEGYRNSLGLCIFLAMARRDEDREKPLILDDVVLSLDRTHRGMVVALLERYFSQRQVIIFTHDRDWYAELRHRLNAKDWLFKTLLPYETPALGIRFTEKVTLFDEARAQLSSRPDAAGNDVRKIMDLELPYIAEKLNISMRYFRGERNDRRTAIEFLDRIIADGKRSFKAAEKNSYVVCQVAIENWIEARKLLVAWGNRGSHSFNLVLAEAEQLIDVCEEALKNFVCHSCGRYVWYAEASGCKLLQCKCGDLRWRR